MKIVTDDIIKSFERCVEGMSLPELSRRTGVHVNLLRRYLNRQSKYIRQETWEKIYPVLRAYVLLREADGDEGQPVRIGESARRGRELDALVSDEKVLIDTFSALGVVARKKVLEKWRSLAPDAKPFDLLILSGAENEILGLFKAMPEEKKQDELLQIADAATEEMRLRRESL